MRVLITGSHGFVGRRFVKKFLAMGYDVTGVDDLSTGLLTQYWTGSVKLAVPEYPSFTTNIIDVRKFFGYADASNYDLILHSAAVVGGRTKIEGDPIAVATDLAIDSDFFQWLVKAKHKPRKVVYFSSSAVYPIELQRETQHCQLNEQLVNLEGYRIGMPDLTYGWSKLTGELLAKHAAEKYDLPVVVYRPFSGYGEDQDLSYPFPAIIQRIVNREKPIKVWGSGRQVRDWIHIDDVVECVLATMTKLKPGEALNIGSGHGISFERLARQACLHLSHTADIKVDLDKPAGVFHRVADPTKMHGYYRPKIQLEEGILRVYEHLKSLDKVPATV